MIAVFLLVCFSVGRAALLVQTQYGPVMGYSSTSGVDTWLGIPYAAPPTGSLRFTPAAAHAPWTTTIEALEFGPMCAQPTSVNSQISPAYCFQSVSGTTSEDCLTLNVWAPENATNLPVMVFFGGCAFTNNDISTITYDGSHLASNVVVVTVNYRVGALGFLSWGNQTSGESVPNNLGILDQIFALSWVHTNIQNFGGNANQVTIFGQGSGGISVCLHLTIPQSQAFFDQAIIESGACMQGNLAPATNPMFYNLTWQQQIVGEPFAVALNCTTLACFQNASLTDILSAQARVSTTGAWYPVIDGVYITSDPINALAKENLKAPVLIGTTLNDGSIAVPAWDMTDTDYANEIKLIFPNDSSIILSQYPPTSYNSPAYAWTQVWTDYYYTCTTFRLMDVPKSPPLYQYVWTHKLSWIKCPGLWCQLDPYEIYTGSEIYFVFGNPPLSFTTAEQTLSQSMMEYWTSFAASGVPSSNTAAVAWPKYTSTSGQYLTLDINITVSTFYSPGACTFWDQLTEPSS